MENISLGIDPDGITVQFEVYKDGVHEKSHAGMIPKYRSVDDIVQAIQKMALGTIQNDIYQAVIFPQVVTWFDGRTWELG